MTFWKKSKPEEPVTPVLYKLELEFTGPNNKLVKETHLHVKRWDFWIQASEKFYGYYHRIEFADGKIMLIAEQDDCKLTRVTSTNE